MVASTPAQNDAEDKAHDIKARASPTSRVCLMEQAGSMDEQAGPADGSRGHAPSSPTPSVTGAATDRTGEMGRTPRSEAHVGRPDRGLNVDVVPSQQDMSYFSPRPLRPYASKLPASTPGSARPSPAGSIDSSSPLSTERPVYQRDDSNISTASVATVRAHSVDPGQLFTAPRHQLDGPFYPNQSYIALQSQAHPLAYYPSRERKNPPHHGHFSSLSAHIRTSGFGSDYHHRNILDSGSRTVGNSPVGSPGLFNPMPPTTPPLRHVRHEDGLYSSPYLHPTHRQAPKETHVADVTLNSTGNKIINQYEIMDELGRGVHGKVKLGRNMDTGESVAIKIVDRFPKKRRLNKDSSREDKIKREIAILKKARHPNIVSLLEVIDDPSRKKVYIILEHVELGEVRWRTDGDEAICLIEWLRYQKKARGGTVTEQLTPEERQLLKTVQRKALKAQHKRRLIARTKLGHPEFESWSLEMGGESEEEFVGSYGSGRLSRASTRSTGEGPSRALHHDTNMETAVRSSTPLSYRSRDPESSTALEGTMYGAYESERGRKPSVADSQGHVPHLSSDDTPIPEPFRHVPTLTLQAALEAFRDTVLGLEFLHFQDVVHRDIKPANLLQTREHRIKISDFGVSYLGRAKLENEEAESESDMLDAEAIELAKTVGTPAFYAPELCKLDDDGDPLPVTKAIDIWALGVTLYCLIYGRVPFYEENEFKLMRTIVEQDVVIPHYRLKAVTESGSRPSSHGRLYHSTNSSKRLPQEPEYEQVPPELRDLLQKLLTKDPRCRITIPQIKQHRWVVQGVDNYDAWLHESDPDGTSQGKRIEVSKDDMEQAVVPVTFVERVRHGVRKIATTVMGMGARGGSRRRAESAATSPDPSHQISAHSSSSSMSQDSRRPSAVSGLSILDKIHQARESEHPLAQSVSASPEANERANFFGSSSRKASPSHGSERLDLAGPLAASRPFMERGYSDMSSAASVRTIRQSDLASDQKPSTRAPPTLPPTANSVEPLSTPSLGIFGNSRLISSMRSREKLPKTTKRPEQPKAAADWIMDSSDDPHSGPSVAVCTEVAAGKVDHTEVLEKLSPRAARSRGTSLSQVCTLEPKDKAPCPQPPGLPLTLPPKPAYDLQATLGEWSGFQGKPAPVVQQRLTEIVPSSKHAKETLGELLDKRHREEYGIDKPLISSSSEDGLSHSTSNPSIPSVPSATSSLAPDEFSHRNHPFTPPKSEDTPLSEPVDKHFGLPTTCQMVPRLRSRAPTHMGPKSTSQRGNTMTPPITTATATWLVAPAASSAARPAKARCSRVTPMTPMTVFS